MMRQFDGRFAVMFHQVEDDKKKWYDERYAVAFETFRLYLDRMQREGVTFVPPYDILKPDRRKKAVLTFDDVYEGVYLYAYPYLKERKIPFVVFPAIAKLEEEGFLSGKMLAEMTAHYDGCFVGAHSFSHRNLRHLSAAECESEIIGAGDRLETITEKKIDILAYPFGDFSAVGRRERKFAQSRYRMAFGTLQAGITAETDPFYIPRMNLNETNIREYLQRTEDVEGE